MLMVCGVGYGFLNQLVEEDGVFPVKAKIIIMQKNRVLSIRPTEKCRMVATTRITDKGTRNTFTQKSPRVLKL
jgi:hypothetical protein